MIFHFLAVAEIDFSSDWRVGLKMETIWLQRSNSEVPWGFRLQGGREFAQPLSVQKVRKQWCNKMFWPRNYFDHNAPMVLWRVNTYIYTSTCKCVPTLDVSNLFPIYSIALILKVVLLVRNTLHSCRPLHTVFLHLFLLPQENEISYKTDKSI
jgi:hypothetical protein